MTTAPFTFADLFAGIGGLGDAPTWLGGRCSFPAEIDTAPRQMLLTRHPDLPAGAVMPTGNAA